MAMGLWNPSEFSGLSLETLTLPPANRPLVGLAFRSEFFARQSITRIG
jgi:hypothetical protein